jgi:lysophospholipase L1-like esterase
MSLDNLFNKKIIFFGDSITDANRLLNPKYPNGFGFVSMINDDYAINHSYANITILNKGISGNKTSDLLNRIDDILNESPDVVIILIGINDIWHPYGEGKKADLYEFISNLKKIVNTFKEKKIRTILMTPFLFPVDEYLKDMIFIFNELYYEMTKYITSERIEYIDLYKPLKEYALIKGNHTVTLDGVHPTILGHGIIAQQVINYLWISE